MSINTDQVVRLWATYRYPASRLLTFVGTVIGILGGTAAITPIFTNDAAYHQLAQSFALAGIAVASLVAFTAREFIFARRQKLANTVDKQNEAAKTLRDLTSFLLSRLEKLNNSETVERETLSRARLMLEDILEQYASIFSFVTSTRCRICIKLVNGLIDGEMYLFTLARDKISSRENRPHDKRRESELHDLLNNNSEFVSLFSEESGLSSFFSNDLTTESNYRSSSFNYWKTVDGDPNTPSDENWPLKYKSTIVWPIRQDVREDLGISEMKCVGFLAVDSWSRGAFIERWDAPLGEALASNLFTSLALYAELDSKI